MNKDPEVVFQELMKLPSIEEATRYYTEMSVAIRKELSEKIKSLRTFKVSAQQRDAGCTPASDEYEFDAVSRHLVDYYAPGKLSDDEYEKALEVIKSVTKNYGFTDEILRLHDSPGIHDARMRNKTDGTEFSIGTGNNTVIGIDLGCHLKDEDKRRGYPLKTK